MSEQHLHIISLEIPYPPTRGNVMGIFHRIRALREAGITITLHAFYKTISFPEELTNYCKAIYFYPRKPMWQVNNLHDPLFVQSRRGESIFKVLLLDSDPILFEGLHTLFHFDDIRLKDRKKYVRMHNIESFYYRHLASITTQSLKKGYYTWESLRCAWLEATILKKANGVFAISQDENHYLISKGVSSSWLPPFHSHIEPHDILGTGTYALYHGDLRIKENEDAAIFLIDQVFSMIHYPLVIAGYLPSTRLVKKAEAFKNIRLIPSPAPDSMRQLVQEAHMILLPFSQSTGYKMKMIDSLALGRHIVTSQIMRVYSELTELIHFADSASNSWIQVVYHLSTTPFTAGDRYARTVLFDSILNNKRNAQKIIDLIYPG